MIELLILFAIFLGVAFIIVKVIEKVFDNFNN